MRSLETVLQHTFQDSDLLAAICHHESVLSSSAALQRYGYAQNDLAFRGDALMYFLAADYVCHRGLAKEFRSRLVSNRLMRLWVKEYAGLSREFVYRLSDNASEKKLNHVYGTFFEALVYGLFLEAGYESLRDYLETAYFDALVPRVIEEMEAQIREAKLITGTSSKYYTELSRVVGQVFHGRLGVSCGLSNPQSSVIVTSVHFHVPEKKGKRKQHAKFVSKRSGPVEALEEVCLQGLRFVRKRRGDIRFQVSF